MSDVVDRITARLDAMEAAAKAALALHGSGTTWPLGHPLDPAAVLAMLAGLSSVVALHPHEDAGGLCPEETCGLCGAWWPCPTLLAVAAAVEAVRAALREGE